MKTNISMPVEQYPPNRLYCSTGSAVGPPILGWTDAKAEVFLPVGIALALESPGQLFHFPNSILACNLFINWNPVYCVRVDWFTYF